MLSAHAVFLLSFGLLLMRVAFQMISLCILMLLLSPGPATAHYPEGSYVRILGIPDDYLPTLDGDLSDWDLIPSNYWYTLDSIDGNTSLPYFQPYGGKQDDPPEDTPFEFIMGWNCTLERLYFALFLHGDPCEGDDTVWIHIDADHSGGTAYYSTDDFPDTEEGQEDRLRQMGRNSQQSVFRWSVSDAQSIDEWHSMWTSTSTWYNVEPYSCCHDSWDYYPDEGYFAAEWYTVLYDEFDHDSPENSKFTKLVDHQVIGIGISICADEEEESKNGWSTGDLATYDWRLNSSYLIDGHLWPPEEQVWYPGHSVGIRPCEATGVQTTSWAQIKAAFQPGNRREP